MSLSSVSTFDTSFSTNDMSATPTTDHTLYYLTDGNLKLQLDDGTIYNVHRYFFDAYSSRFAEEYLDDMQLVDDEEPVIKLSDITREDFDRFLSLMYPSAIGVRDVLTADEWLSVLRLATRWSFDELRALAIRELEPIASAVDRNVVARELGKPEWLLPALVDVCMAPKWMGLEDAERLDMKTVVEIGRIREEMREAGDWDDEDVARAVKRAELGARAQGVHASDVNLVQEVTSDEGDVEPQEAEARESEAPSSPKKTVDDSAANPQTLAAPYITHKNVSASTLPVVEHCIATISRDASTSTSEDGSDITHVVTRDAGDVASHNVSARDAIDVAAPNAAFVTAKDEVKPIATEDEEIDEALLVSAAPLPVLEAEPPACDATIALHDAAATPDDAANPNVAPAAIPEPPSETLDVAQEAPASGERCGNSASPAGGLDTLVDSALKPDAPIDELLAPTKELAAPTETRYPADASTSFTAVISALQEGSTAEEWRMRTTSSTEVQTISKANVTPAVVKPTPSSSLSKGESSQAFSSAAKAPPLVKPALAQPATPTASSTTPALAMRGRKRQASDSSRTSAKEGQEPPAKPLVQGHTKVAVLAAKPASPPPCPNSRSRSPDTTAAAGFCDLPHKEAFDKEAKTTRVDKPKVSTYPGVPFTNMGPRAAQRSTQPSVGHDPIVVDDSWVSPAKEQRAATRPSLSTKAPALAPVPAKPATPVKPVQAFASVKPAPALPPPPPRYPAQSPAQPSWIPAQSPARKHTYGTDALRPGEKPPLEEVTTRWNTPAATSPSRRHFTHDDYYGAYEYSSSRGGWDEDGWNLGATASRTSKSTQPVGPSRRKTSEHSPAPRPSYSYFGAPRFQRLSKEEVKKQQKKNPMFGIFATFDD